MNPILNFAMEIAVLEFCLVILLILLIVTITIKRYFIARSEKYITNKIEYQLLKIMRNTQKYDASQFPARLKSVKNILQVITKFDKEKEHSKWFNIRGDFLRQTVLPLAREDLRRSNPVTDLYASAVFVLDAEDKDQQILSTIKYESNPLAYLNCCLSGIKFGFKDQIEGMLGLLAQTSWIYQTAFSYLFHGAPYKTQMIIKDVLENTSNTKLKAICYDVLTELPKTNVNVDVEKDIQSTELMVKIAAIRFIAYNDPIRAVPILIDLLDDPHFEVKLVSIHRIYMLNAIEAIPKLMTCLNDENSLVRVSAAKAIIHLDKEGIQIVQKYAPQINIELCKMGYTQGMMW